MQITMRRATQADVDSIWRLSNDGGPDGRPRRATAEVPQGCYEAFARISATPDNELMVAEVDGRVVGTLHLTFLTYLAGEGRQDAQVESVHVHRDYRRRGIGAHMMRWAIEQAQQRRCRRMQLTTNKLRADAHRFYKRLGFVASHEGMKLDLT